jgi:tRNA A-37 threonylcarbamoyl transferase component Bud32
VGDVELAGDYVLGERLGGGGFGEVFAATHRVIGGDAAVKILHAYRCSDPIAVTRFVAEARAVNKVRHPGIVDVFDFGELPDGRHYFVMERLRGQTLRAILDERKRLPRDEAVPLLRKIAAAVDAAHEAGVTHRDLKPDNIFVAGDGEIKLIDFGIAKLSTDATMTATDMVLGTPAYMSPEQCRGGTVDERSDLYSFGALAYHMLVGTPPFDGDPLALALHHLNDRPPRPSKHAEVSVAVDEPILALLEKDPALRPRPLVAVVERIAGPARFPWKRFGRVAGALALTAFAVVGVREILKPPPPPVIDPTKIVVRHVPLEGDALNIFWMTPDGHHVRYMDEKGGREQSLDDGTVTASPYAPFPVDLQGRQLLSSDVTQIQPVGSKQASEITGEWPVPCGHLIASIARGRLLVTDENTLATRDLGPTPGVWGSNWSPSCRRLVYATSDRVVHLTDAVIGTSSVLDLPMARRAPNELPAAFVGEDAIAYCKEQPGRVEATLHYLDDRGPDVPLVTLSPEVAACRVVSSADGHRVDVLPMKLPVISVVSTTKDGSPVVRPVLTKDEFVEQFIDDDTWIVTSVYGNPPPDPLVPSSQPQLRHSRRVTRDSSTPIATCRGESAIIKRGGVLAHVVLDTSLELFDDTCTRIAAWTLPELAAVWSRPSCVDTMCVIAALDHDVAHVFSLDVGSDSARTLFNIPADVPARDSIPVEQIALSPDKKMVVMLKDATPRFELVELATKAHRTIVLGEGLGPALEYPIWADATHFYMSTNGLDISNGNYAAVDLFELTGNFKHVSGQHRYGTLSAVSPSGSLISVRMNEYFQDQFVVDLPPFERP